MMVNLVRYYDDIGTLISQTVFIPDVVRTEDERNALTALLLMQSGGALALQLLGIGSAYFLFISSVPLFGALSLNALLNRGGPLVSLWTYALGMLVPLLSGTRMACIVLDVFVPLVCLPCTLIIFNLIFYIVDWTLRCGCSCRTYHRITRHACTISRCTARYALLAPLSAKRTRKSNHDNELRNLSYSGGICSPLTLRRTTPASDVRVKFR
jgi:hypothetical protein